MESYYAQDIGERAEQEDNFLALSAAFPDHNSESGIFAVADGIGRLDRGEMASRIAVRELDYWFRNELPFTYDKPFLSLLETFTIIQSRIHQEAAKKKVQSGTTLTALFIHKGKLTCFWLGDSKAWILRGEQVIPLTSDHIDVDSETGKYALTLACVSFGPKKDPDQTGPVDLIPGDKLVLATDGAAVDPGLLSELPASAIPQAMIELSTAAGNGDNKTALCIVYKGDTIHEEDKNTDHNTADHTRHRRSKRRAR